LPAVLLCEAGRINHWTCITTHTPQLTPALHARISGEGNFFVGLAKAKADRARDNMAPINVVWWTIGKQYMKSANDWSDTQIFIKAMELAPRRDQLTSCEPRVRFLPIPVVLTAAATDSKPRLSKETVGLVRQWCTSKSLLQAPPACWRDRAPKRARGGGGDKANRESEASESEAGESKASEGKGEEELGSVRDDADARQAAETEKRASRASVRCRGRGSGSGGGQGRGGAKDGA